jgi:hypothetical protein
MRKIILLFSFLVGSSVCNAQEVKADNNIVRGKYFGMNHEQGNFSRDSMEYPNFKIKKGHRYKSSNFSAKKWQFTEISSGKWKLKNDTLFLIEKWYKKNPKFLPFGFARGKKIKTKEEPSRKQVTKLVLIQGRWTEMNPITYRFTATFNKLVRQQRWSSHKHYKDEQKKQLSLLNKVKTN